MDAKKTYVTQLSAQDLREIAATVNMIPGNGINIIRNGENLSIEINQQALASMIQSFCAQKGIAFASEPDPRDMNLDQV